MFMRKAFWEVNNPTWSKHSLARSQCLQLVCNTHDINARWSSTFLRFLSEVVSRVLSITCLCEKQRIVGGDSEHIKR